MDGEAWVADSEVLALAHEEIDLSTVSDENNRPEYEIAVTPPAAARGVVSVGALQLGD